MERTADWYQANQRVLAAGIGAIREVLDIVAHDPADGSAVGVVDGALRSAEAEMPSPSSLAELVGRFQLTGFERDLLLLCAGIELDPALSAAWQHAAGTPGAFHPTLSLALEVFPNAHWSAITPGSVLRRARLLALGDGPTLGARPLRIEEPVLHFLNGLPELDARLDGIVTPHQDALPLATFQRSTAQRIVRMLEANRTAGAGWPVTVLSSRDPVAALSVASQAASGIGAGLCRLAPDSLPAEDEVAADLIDLWDRDSVLLNSALFIDLTPHEGAARRRSVLCALNRQRGLLFVAASNEDLGLTRRTFGVSLRPLAADDRRALWPGYLPEEAGIPPHTIDGISETFPFDATTMAEVAQEMRYIAGEGEDAASSELLLDRCRQRMRTALDPVAQRLEASAAWGDLVLPPLQLEMLQSLTAQIRNRPRISRLWAPRAAAVEGPTALFVGERGTGKTLAATVVAAQLRRDLYRVDAADLFGSGDRTRERRTSDVLRAAAGAEIVLLVDLPDEFLQERGFEGSEAHLARLRALLGLAGAMPVVFESREGGAVPQSFLREMRFVVRFPHPSADLRREIWRRAFPETVERKAIDDEKLARLPLVGGSIHAIAFDAALRAAEEGSPVTMGHLERAARVEYAKLGKTLSPVETRGWVSADTGKREQKKGEKR